jgi:hypothetical protein|tara:strand:+ start:671 stop:880 length:210 start_codon:yes stop_codon:yes gene_type:complete
MKRQEAAIILDIANTYSSLSPENISYDGERSSADIKKAKKVLTVRLKALFKEIGRTVGENEAYGAAYDV